MGWSYGFDSRRQLIDSLTSDSTRANHVCIRHCTSGNTLWSVWAPRGVTDPQPDVCFIECCLMQRFGNEWAYKSFGEAEHPYQYSCPPAYLKLAKVRNETWRSAVAQHWKARSELAKLNRDIKKLVAEKKAAASKR